MKHLIYQVFTRLWGEGKFADWDEQSLSYVSSLGFDYIWFTGIPRHASGKDFVKGDPGCPYSVSDWKDTNPYFASNPEHRIEEFDNLLNRTHNAGLKVLIDYIPNHVAKDYEGRIVHHDYYDADWSDTLKVDWTSEASQMEMLDVLRFWTNRGVDGFRCDMVELVPKEKLADLIFKIKQDYPDLLFVAEVYNKRHYRDYLQIGFDLLYDKSGLYDSLYAISNYGHSAREITRNWQCLSDMQPKMLNFLENHDERRRAIDNFAALGVSLLFNTASFMLYYGQEFGEDASESSNKRTSIFDWSQPKMISDLYRFIHLGQGLTRQEKHFFEHYRMLLAYAQKDVFRSGRCWDLCYCNMNNINPDRHFAFMRFDDRDTYLVLSNFSDYDCSLTIHIPSELMPFTGDRSEFEVFVPALDCVVFPIK